MGQELDNLEAEVWPVRLLVGFLCLVEFVICLEPVSVWQVNHALKVRVLLCKHERFFPLFTLNVKLHQLLDIAKTKIGLLCESVMTVLSEELSAKLNFSNVLRSVKVLADVHDGVEVRALSEDFNRFLVLACLNVKFGGLLPVVTVALELGLLDQNHGVEERSLPRSVLSVFSDQVVRFLELLQRRI